MNNLKQDDIAKILRMDRSNYGKYEREEIALNYEYAKLLANYYNVSIDYIYGEIHEDDVVITSDLYNKILKAHELLTEVTNQLEGVYGSKTERKRVKNSSLN